MSDSLLKDASQPALIVTGGQLDGTVLGFEKGAEKVVGSGAECHLRLPAENVSALHARVAWDGRALVLKDAGASAGTFVNGEKAGASQVLRDGDRVSLGPPGSKGSVKLLVRLPPGSETFQPEMGDDLIVLDVDEPASPQAAPPPAARPRTPAAPAVPVRSDPVPAAPAHTPPAVATPAASPSVPPPAAAEKRTRPEYSMEMPSIVPERAREPSAMPPVMETALRTKVKPPAARRSFSLPAIPRVVLVGAGALAVAGGGVLGYMWLRPPRPVMTTVSPAKAEPGQTVTLSGFGFDASPARNAVKFGTEAGQVTSASATQLAVVVPTGLSAAGSPNLQVTVETRGGASNALFLRIYRGPRVTTLEPDVALPGDEITVSGKNLAGQPLAVTFGGVPGEVASASPTAVKVKVPGLPVVEGRTIDLQVQVGSESSPPAKLILGRLPLVTEVTPTSGRPGERVTLKGRGFDAEAPRNVVQFGNDRAMVLSASATELAVVAPAPSTPGSQVQSPVVVQAGGRTSSGGKSFTVLRPSVAAFTPWYFPAPVTEHSGHDHVFVSTELGPSLLLSGKADAASTAERAARVSLALNKLVEQAAAKPSTLELRDASVAVAGGEVLVSATAQDAAGYSEPWEGGSRGAQATPRAVAGLWAALLQDHLALFVEKQRPHHVLEISPRGKALLDLYSEAVRRVGAGRGVPPGLVSPLPATQARALRDMALLLPAPGQASAAAGVTGAWEGTMEERGSTRPFRLTLRMDGNRLVGTMATQAGKLAMNVPLKSATYEKSVLTFVVASGGSVRRFSGTVEGATINGTIQADGRGEALGRFTLRYLE